MRSSLALHHVTLAMIASVNEINHRPPPLIIPSFITSYSFRMPRSFFFAVVAVFVARYHAADAAKTKNEDVTCVCTKSPYNDVKIKVARCDIGTYYTACCNIAHPLFMGHCTYMAPSKSVKGNVLKAAPNNSKPAGLGSNLGEGCKRDKDCPDPTYLNPRNIGCCKDGVCVNFQECVPAGLGSNLGEECKRDKDCPRPGCCKKGVCGTIIGHDGKGVEVCAVE